VDNFKLIGGICGIVLIAVGGYMLLFTSPNDLDQIKALLYISIGMMAGK
jgi:hypothetical protein